MVRLYFLVNKSKLLNLNKISTLILIKFIKLILSDMLQND